MAKKKQKTLTEDEKKQLDFSKNFINATKAILEQYDDFVVQKVSENENYKDILFMNCLYGLLMMPSKLNMNMLWKTVCAHDVLSDNNLLGNNKIVFNTSEDETISFAQFVKSIRNGLAHWNDSDPKKLSKHGFQGIEFDYTNTLAITRITIYGSYNLSKTKTRDKGKTIHLEIRFNFLQKDVILKFLKLVYAPTVKRIKIVKKTGSKALSDLRILFNNVRISTSEPKQVLWKEENELCIQHKTGEETCSISKLPFPKEVTFGDKKYIFEISQP